MANSRVLRVSNDYALLLEREHQRFCSRQRPLSLIEFTRKMASSQVLIGGNKEKEMRLF